MRKGSRRWYSHSLGREMDVLVYGEAGQPLIAFPSQNGRVADWEGFGMVDECADMLESGRLLVVAVDSIDHETWTNESLEPGARARRHEDYHRYLVDEVVPFARGEARRQAVWATGCSMGAFHAANLFFRQPDIVNGVIAISGLYQPRLFVGDYCDDTVYFNSPLYYLPGMEDPWYLERYRESPIVFCAGQGRWEEDALVDTRALESVLEAKGIPATFDYWGYDVDHDWPWWRKMLRHHLERLGV